MLPFGFCARSIGVGLERLGRSFDLQKTVKYSTEGRMVPTLVRHC